MLAGLTLGDFIARDRAEVAIFLAYRPWLLLVLVALLERTAPAFRWAGYAAALLLASGSEALVAWLFGGGWAAADAARATVAGLSMAGLLDLAFVVARRVEPRFARLLGGLIALGLLLAPWPRAVFERIALVPGPAPISGRRPAVTLLSGLPLLWAEDGSAYRPSAAMRRLSAEFVVMPIDVATPAALARAPVLLAAQPRELTAGEIDAIDAWVRMGGRAVLLADADLRWPSDLPPGDARRPPRWATLAPLLARWDVTVARTGDRIATIDVATAGGARRIVADAPGIIRSYGACRTFAAARAVWCLIGRGQVLVLADADMLDDRLWVAEGPDGDGRLRRGGDNALLLAEWLDWLAGLRRDRRADSVFWMRRDGGAWVFMGGMLPALLIGLFAACDIRRNRRFGRNAPHIFIHRNKAGRGAEMRDYERSPSTH